MAARVPAVRWCNLQVVVAVDVAGGTGNVRVAVGQEKSRRRVIKLRVQPCVKAVARLASGRKSCTRVIRIRCLLIFPLVTGNTLRRESLKLPNCRALVTFLALHRCVRPKKRKAVLMILHLLHRDIPSANRVTLCAIRTEFPTVNVRVAIRAIFSNVGEDRFHMTLRALHFFVHTSQRIFRVVMVEFRMRADWPPCRRRMAVFTWDCNRPVRAARSLSLG
jgi:hypothetical protein